MTTEKPSVASMDLERSEICTCTACENPDVADDLVACDKCDKWWHFTCAGVNESISSRDWICPRCRTPSIPASERSTTSSRRADLQRKRLAEQQELEKKELELERRQLEMQKKHSQEMYELEESLAGDDGDNRSVRSRVNEIEAREKQVEAWVEQNVATGLASTVHPPGFTPLHHQLPKSSDINIATKNDDEGHNSSHQVPAITVPIGDTNKSSADIPILQSLRSQLAECEQQPVSAERLLNLEAQLRKCRMLISQQEEGAYGGDSIRNSQDRQRSREGALPKIVTNVSDTVGLPKCQVSSVAHSQTRLTGKPNPDLRQSRIEVLQQDSSTGKSRSGPRIRFAPKHIPLGPPLVESTINEQTRLSWTPLLVEPPYLDLETVVRTYTRTQQCQDHLEMFVEMQDTSTVHSDFVYLIRNVIRNGTVLHLPLLTLLKDNTAAATDFSGVQSSSPCRIICNVLLQSN
nr:uncharacterized protein LOC115265007 [Aedes albopictus]